MNTFIRNDRFLKKWSFETSEGEIPLMPQLRHCDKADLLKETAGISVTVSNDADIYGYPIISAERIHISIEPHDIYIIDRIKSEKPVKVKSHFIINSNGSCLKTNVAALTKLVFRRNSAAMKFFQVYSISDNVINPAKLSFDWDCAYDQYILPSEEMSGYPAEKFFVFNYTGDNYGKNHIIVYAAATDHIDRIIGWHIKNVCDNIIHIEPPEKSGGSILEVYIEEGIILRNLYNNISCRIDGNSFYTT